MSLHLSVAADAPNPGSAMPVASRFEFWPSWAFHLPIVAYAVALGLRHGDASLLTAANPMIETGGFCGESKSSILDQAGPGLREVLAAYEVIDGPDPGQALAAAGRLGFPVVLKPDLGCNGAGVRLIRDAAALAAALPLYPVEARLMLQRFIPDEGEAGIFYIRHPHQPQGRVTSLTLKHPASVVGDGRASLRTLILRDPRAGRVPQLYFPRLQGRLDTVPASGERVQLVLVGNHCRGSLFRDGATDITPALEARIERVARGLPEFHFGRIDVRFESLAALRRGEGFTVIEVNGVGSEATHIWDPRTRLWQAWRDQFAHYGAAVRIGRANRARGFQSSGAGAILRALWRQHRLLKQYPISD